jgi:hypothetical protein
MWGGYLNIIHALVFQKKKKHERFGLLKNNNNFLNAWVWLVRN